MVKRKNTKPRPNNSKARLASGNETAKAIRDFFRSFPVEKCDKSLKDLFFMALEHEGGNYWTPQETSDHAFMYRSFTELLWELDTLTKERRPS